MGRKAKRANPTQGKNPTFAGKPQNPIQRKAVF